MKKIYLIAGLILFSSISFSQNDRQTNLSLEESIQLKESFQLNGSNQNYSGRTVPSGLSSSFSSGLLRAVGDTLWNNDFSIPSDWVASSPSPNGWDITSTNKGWFYSSAINSTSGGNYALLENGNPATNSPAPVAGPFTLTTVNPVDLSLNPDVTLTYQIYGARFQDTLQVQISTDGTNFITVGNHQDWPMLTSSGGSVSANPETRSINVSAQAGGQSQVWVRFNWKNGSGSNGNVTYGYMIDDVAFIESNANDLLLSNANFTRVWDNGEIECTIYPFKQAEGNPFTFEAAIANRGSNNQTNVELVSSVTRVGNTSPVYTNSTSYGTFPGFSSDTMMTVTPFLADTMGTYNVSIYLESDSTATSTITKSFEVSDTVYARDLGVAGNGRWQVGNNCGSFIVSNLFDAYADQKATSISAFIHNISKGGPAAEIIGRIYEYDGSAFVLIQSTQFTPVSSTDKNKWKTLQLDQAVQLTAGKFYRVGIEGFSSTDSVFIATSGTSPNFTSHIYDTDGCIGSATPGTTYYITGTPMIRLNVESTFTSIEKIENNPISVSIYPNPNNGEFNLHLENEKAGTYMISISNLIGQQVYSERVTVTNGDMQKSMNLSNFEKGIYFLSIADEGSKAKTVKKIITY